MSTVLRTCRALALSLVVVLLLPMTASAVNYIGIDLYTLQTPNGSI